MENGSDKPFLPPEIIINILKRLPVKSLVRFQCVCRQWKILFKTPSFIAEHLHHSDRKNPFLLLHEYNCALGHMSFRLLDQKMETVDVLSIPFRHGLSILGSCNGLLCVIINLHLSLPSRLLCLWNPAIREVRNIPQSTNDYGDLCVFGFGFSSMVNDYKIVKFYNKELGKKKEEDRNYSVAFRRYDGVEVYSFSTGLWKELEFGAFQNLTFTTTAVSSDGTMAWLGEEDYNSVLVSFDIVSEVFTITPIGDVPPTNLGVWQDKFVIIWSNEDYDFSDDGFNSTEVRLLEQVVSESGKSLRCIDQYSIDTFSHARHPLCIWRNEIVFNGIGSEDEDDDEAEPEYFLNLFNLSTKKWEGLPKLSSAYDSFAGFSYERSLVSVSVCNTQENSAYRKFIHAPLQLESELRLIFKDVVATGEQIFSSSYVQPQSQLETYEVDHNDVYRPTMDEQEGSRESEDELFGTNPAVSTGMTNEMATIGITHTTQTEQSLPSGSASQGKRKRGEGQVKSKRQKMPTSAQIADAVIRMADASEVRSETLKQRRESSVNDVMNDLIVLDVVKDDIDFRVRCIKLLQDKTARETYVSLRHEPSYLIEWLRFMVYNTSS